ncbi:Nuclear transport factor 2 (NTF2) domain protein [Marinomonas aquimarina]|uniref:Nuclear transport factor 2 (NTF2) domain protein n=1 Tax=Marinomonas aquimarina TaxID=295068 RepID=A0A1A8T079_9GAMM|nr:nuclear transport factor 2 family protein [Marinomonas aquimarina]SBS25220.1 Nuclear transport factor 2 (NTF2) domain protein [Marinomonas aquimarina]
MKSSELDTMLMEWQCQKLVTRSINLLDQGRWQELADCYAEDGVLYRPSAPLEKVAGRAAILQSFMARPVKETCHALSNMEVTLQSPTAATVVSRVVLFSGEHKAPDIETIVAAKGNVFIGRFVDQLKKVDGEWVIALRQGSIELNYKGCD